MTTWNILDIIEVTSSVRLKVMILNSYTTEPKKMELYAIQVYVVLIIDFML